MKESTHKIRLKNYKFSEMELGRAVADLSAIRCGTEMRIFLLLLFLGQYSFVIITIIWLKANLTVTILELVVANKTLKSVSFFLFSGNDFRSELG